MCAMPSRPELTGSAHLFAALGDETRLRLIARLCGHGPMSIARLTEHASVTRQAIRKHLRVMEESGLVRSTRHGRESIWQLERRRLEDAQRHLVSISKRWAAGLPRLREFVGDEG